MFVARISATVKEGKEKHPMYLKSDGQATVVRGEAQQFATREELDRFLQNNGAKEGTPISVMTELV